jgi:hypothetical protein
MEHPARIFNCVRCHRQVIICSCCDRGNIYCNSTCSSNARQESMRMAGERYQNTYHGKLNHAKRQKHYMDQKRKKMTHHGSQESLINDLLQLVTYEGLKIIRNDDLRCHFCGRSCSRLLRTLPLGREKVTVLGGWPLGP